MIFPLINREELKNAIKRTGTSYESMAETLGISKAAFAFKISGRKNRGITPFREQEVQILRGLFGDSIMLTAPNVKGDSKNGEH